MAGRVGRSARDVAKTFRALPVGVKATIERRAKDVVAEPLAAASRQAAARSKFSPTVALDIRGTVSRGVPTVRFTARRKRFGGGANTQQVVPGAVWGSGPTGPVQFRTGATDFVYAPLMRSRDVLADAWDKLVDEALKDVEREGN